MMSLEQLQYATDSLSLQFKSDKERVEATLRSINYFKNARKTELPAVVDTLASGAVNPEVSNYSNMRELIMQEQMPTEKQVPINLDSLYNTLSPNSQLRIIDWASNYARASKSYFEDAQTRIDRKEKEINRYNIAWHQKFTLSFACLIFFFIGAPLGAIIRKGGFGMPVVVSILIFILYYIISLSGLKFARESIMPVWEGMWMSSFILLPLGIFLTYKSTTDSGLLSKEAYMNIIKKLSSLLFFYKKLKTK
jgi:lipopolysaccharide export system permease protein